MRMCLAPAVGVPLAYLVAEVLPGGVRFQDNLWLTVPLAVGGLVILRHAVIMPLVEKLLPHRLLVLGTGVDAHLVEASLGSANPFGMKLVGFYPIGNETPVAVPRWRVIDAGGGSFVNTVRSLRVNEIVVAVGDQQGGALPLDALLDCRLGGVRITDFVRFFERVHGQVPVRSVKTSWLVFANGFRQSAVRAFFKRLVDIVLALTLIAVVWPLMAIFAAAIALESGFPVIYRQKRVGYRGRIFTLFKFRSMRKDAERDGKASWAAANDARVTFVGRLMRKARIDELPQLINVLRGEMSFVGPRPERPEFVEMLSRRIPFYAMRHAVKPGLSGWAQVRFTYGASVEEAQRKLEFDLYYVKNHTVVLDLIIMLETVRVVLFGEGAR